MLLDGRSESDPVLVDADSGVATTVGDVLEHSARLSDSRRGLTFLIPDRSVDSFRLALALLESGSAVALIDGSVGPTAVSALIDRYQPGRILDPAGLVPVPESARECESGWEPQTFEREVHPDLAVLLTTSGSTGTPHLVRLSVANVGTNARQIAERLELTPADKAITSMPLTYSFGLSVLTSHAVSGGTLVVSGKSVVESALWDEIDHHGVTCFAGVPATYKMLKRLRRPRTDSSLRLLIQAGGRLDPDLGLYFHAEMERAQGRFVVMYGQTEASPRMTVLPSDRLPHKPGSVGLPLAGGRIRILDDQGEPVAPGVVGRVVYQGPNVMMGYADDSADICRGDTFGDVLDTGDEGYLDDDGYLYLSGRTKRICKLNGVRVSLDDVETIAAQLSQDRLDVAAVSPGEDRLILVVEGDSGRLGGLTQGVARTLRVPESYVNLCTVAALPRLANGKTDYPTIGRALVR